MSNKYTGIRNMDSLDSAIASNSLIVKDRGTRVAGSFSAFKQGFTPKLLLNAGLRLISGGKRSGKNSLLSPSFLLPFALKLIFGRRRKKKLKA